MKDTTSRLKALFECATNSKGVPLCAIFATFAREWGMCKNSVRNMYYTALKKASEDSEFALLIGANGATKKNFRSFTKQEEKTLLEEIAKRVDDGLSIRRACYELSNGNVELMLRYQNKYRSLVYGASGKHKSVKFAIKSNGVLQDFTKKANTFHYGERLKLPNNVVFFEKREKTLSNGELESLFLGLVKLVKSSAVAEASGEFRQKCNRQAIEIRNLVKDINQMRDELEKSKHENEQLKSELSKLKMDSVTKYGEFVQKLKLPFETKNEQEK